MIVLNRFGSAHSTLITQAYATGAQGLWNNADTMSASTLASLHPGDSATIVAIHADQALHQRLQALGFRKGKQIELVRQAAFSGPLQVRLGTTDVVLRRAEACKIEVCKGVGCA